ncbi:glycosyltransferase [Flavobacteriaceae bacterium]|nr:glycosyltransferase [Flavobacteriaceae bacterium]
MRVLHLSNVIGEKKGGGIHEVVSNLYRYQKKYKLEPHVWFPGNIEDADSFRLDNNIKCLDTYGDVKFGFVKDLFKPISEEVDKFDILHQHGLWMPVSMLSKKMKKKTNIKKVVQTHGFLMPYSRNLSKLKKDLIFSIYERSNIESSDMLVACAKEEAIVLRNLFPNKTIAIIPNGISDEFFNTENKTKIFKRKKRMLFLSQIIPVKGLERIIKSFKEIGVNNFLDWEFIIAGYEDPQYKRILENMITDFGLNDVVKFIGPKFGLDKIQAFDNTDVFLLPSYSENFGIVVAEALSRGVPVLTTKGTPWGELESNNCGFWVDNTDLGIKNGILQILQSSKEELKEMGVRGKKLISEKYLWSKCALKTSEMYQWILNKGLKPSFIDNF